MNPGPDSSALWHVAISVEDWTNNIVLRRHPIPIISISLVRGDVLEELRFIKFRLISRSSVAYRDEVAI
jgi:hypothetical protein